MPGLIKGDSTKLLWASGFPLRGCQMCGNKEEMYHLIELIHITSNLKRQFTQAERVSGAVSSISLLVV